jgi:hypothetical protein
MANHGQAQDPYGHMYQTQNPQPTGTGGVVAHQASTPVAFQAQPLPADIMDDVNHRLGRANGNVYRRKPGVEGAHDGELMIRLKKKRFIILDYTPEEGVTKPCNTQGCPKTARPKCVYDSDPDEPKSLYLRSGLCFTCQRSVNEKRRSNRKSGEGAAPNSQRSAAAAAMSSPPSFSSHKGAPGATYQHQMSGNKRAHGQVYYQAPVNPNAIIIDGPVGGARPADEHYTYSEIGVELQHLTRHLVTECDSIVAEAAKGKSQGLADPSQMSAAVAQGHRAALPGLSRETRDTLEAKYQLALGYAKKGVYQLTQWKSSWEMTLAATDAYNKGNVVPAPVKEEPIAYHPPSQHQTAHREHEPQPQQHQQQQMYHQTSQSHQQQGALPNADAELETFAV